MKRKGRPEKIKASERSILRELALEQPLATLDELVKAFQIKTGLQVHSATLRKALARIGIVRVKPSVCASTTTTDQTIKRYGYQDRHRPSESAVPYPSSLTDAEWNLVQDLFEREGERGVPAKIPRRALVDACCYVVRTGCAWRLLPKDFPHWDNVYKTFRRWSDLAGFSQTHR